MDAWVSLGRAGMGADGRAGAELVIGEHWPEMETIGRVGFRLCTKPAAKASEVREAEYIVEVMRLK